MKREKLLLPFLIGLFMFCNGIIYVNAQETTVHIDPQSSIVPQVEETFSVNVSIINVTNLFAYDFVVWYNTTMMDCVKVEWPANHFLTPILDPNNIFNYKNIKDDFNDTTGYVQVGATLINGEPAKNGSGVLATITFIARAVDGPSSLKLYWPGFDYPVKLSDPDANSIPCISSDGEVTVVPEFTLHLMLLLLFAITLAVVFLRKASQQAKRMWKTCCKCNVMRLRT